MATPKVEKAYLLESDDVFNNWFESIALQIVNMRLKLVEGCC
jgi:hypothetical protein